MILEGIAKQSDPTDNQSHGWVNRIHAGLLAGKSHQEIASPVVNNEAELRQTVSD